MPSPGIPRRVGIGPELIAAQLAQGATAALMVPQVLATLHLLFADASRARAFGIYGIVLGFAGAAGFLLGGILVTLDLAGLGWRPAWSSCRWRGPS